MRHFLCCCSVQNLMYSLHIWNISVQISHIFLFQFLDSYLWLVASVWTRSSSLSSYSDLGHVI